MGLRVRGEGGGRGLCADAYLEGRGGGALCASRAVRASCGAHLTCTGTATNTAAFLMEEEPDLIQTRAPIQLIYSKDASRLCRAWGRSRSLALSSRGGSESAGVFHSSAARRGSSGSYGFGCPDWVLNAPDVRA